ncbi:glycosyltransferase family 2 protein [Arthrobacter psychrochitiniphilus]|uniref:glycosyltransferase family 2 protein n=1 Tax=Arthrobacter psychrochitiniphilus TaxID=291045 RepID=UPI003F7C79B3
MTGVSVVIATIGRPQMLRDAVRAILAQDFPDAVEIVVVFDGIAIDELADVQIPPNRSLQVMLNSRTEGLAGGRNTGILSAREAVIGFCDDDDFWDPHKLARQLKLWSLQPDAIAISAGIRIQSEAGSTDRVPPYLTSFNDFLDSRVTAIHPSTMLFRREDLLGRIGLVDEALPGSYGEDYDLLLRASRYGHVAAVQSPLVTVRWDRPSFFAGKWHNIAVGLTYILRKFPEFETSPKGISRIAAQVAFSYAALGERRTALRWVRSALRRNPRQLRAYGALAVATGAVPAQTLLNAVNRWGRGL